MGVLAAEKESSLGSLGSGGGGGGGGAGGGGNAMGAYTFAAAPKALPMKAGKRNKTPPNPPHQGPASAGDANAAAMNIMFDRRVVRGNTYATQVLPAVALEAEATQRSVAGSTTQSLGKSKSLKKQQSQSTPRRGSLIAGDNTEPVQGRKHMDVQTDVYLEELVDRIPEADVDTQTDEFMDRPPTPLFIPTKSGIEEGDLFNFDREVEPLLEVLVGKALEQGLMEVMEEEELANLRAHQEHFEQVRNAELVAAQRLEAAERRRIEEKERRIAQEKARVAKEKEVREKVAAQSFARSYLSGMMTSVFKNLYSAGFFYDPVKEHFMPWLVSAAAADAERERIARAAVEQLIAHTVRVAEEQRAAAEVKRARERTEELERIAEATRREAEAARMAVQEKCALAGKLLRLLCERRTISEEQCTEARKGLEAQAQARIDEREQARQVPSDTHITHHLLLQVFCPHTHNLPTYQQEQISAFRASAMSDAEARGEEYIEVPESDIPVSLPPPADTGVDLNDEGAVNKAVLQILLEKGTVVQSDLVVALALDNINGSTQRESGAGVSDATVTSSTALEL
eukprot:jgi/Chlat1/3825/Chrsp26S03970